MNLLRKPAVVIVAILLLPMVANADLVTFDFTVFDDRDLTTFIVEQDGVSLLIDNPNGNTLNGRNTFSFVLGGLFTDGGAAPNVDFTFSEDVRLVSYTISNDDEAGVFDLVQGSLESLGQLATSAGTFPFSNTTDIFLGNTAISMSHRLHNNDGFSFSFITVETVGVLEPVSIDIKPGSDTNCLNINGHGVIPVAVLGSETFDAASIDITTLSFGGLDVRVRGNKGPLCSLEDVNDDGLNDLVCQFQDNPDYWDVGEDEATLTGALLDGTKIEGTDSICIVP